MGCVNLTLRNPKQAAHLRIIFMGCEMLDREQGRKIRPFLLCFVFFLLWVSHESEEDILLPKTIFIHIFGTCNKYMSTFLVDFEQNLNKEFQCIQKFTVELR